MEIATKILNSEKLDWTWARNFLLSMLIPVAILVFCPFGLGRKPAALFGCIVLVIIWWSFGTVSKVFAACFLLGGFLLYGISPTVVFSFPLSETFLLIVLCYVFSRGIENSEIAQQTLGPLLFKYVNTPFKAILSAILILLLGMYLIPQPLARLLLTVCLIKGHLDHTDASKEIKQVIIFSIFVFYATVNMMAMRADIILNTSAVGFSGMSMTEGDWLKAMAVPTIAYSLMALGLFSFQFKKTIFGVKLCARKEINQAPNQENLSAKDKRMLVIMLGTVILWATASLHGISASVVTLLGIILMFLNNDLHVPDLKSIDVTTLVFLTAAFSIGGAMKASGIAEHVFGTLAGIFPKSYSVFYILTIIGVSMVMHLILGSNTTTLSIVLPGLMSICSGIMPQAEVFFIAFFTIAAQYILPFHSVAMMIGASNNYFPASYVTKFGVPLTFILLLSVFCFYIPWWQIIHLI